MALTLADVRARDWIAPIPLVTITTLSGAVLRFSDRVVTVGGLTYDSLLLGHSSIDQAIDWDGRGALSADLTLTLRNDAVTLNEVAYSSLIAALDVHPIDRARVQVSFACTDGDETTETETPFVGIAESPQDITTESLSLRCSSVHAYMAKKNPLEVLSTGAFSYLTGRAPAPEDIGKALPILFGAACIAGVVRSGWGGRATLAADISAAATTITVRTPNDIADGTVVFQIEDEVAIGAYSAGSITSVVRGYLGTSAATHAAGAVVYQTGANYGIVANHAVDAIHYAMVKLANGTWAQLTADALQAAVTYAGKTRARATIDTSDYVNSFHPVSDFVAVVDGMASDDAFFGTVGSVIQRPDLVIKAWLVKILGYVQADIDATSFDAAGAWYAANNYSFVVEIEGSVDSRAIAQRMAFNCRSILQELAGVWYLSVIPDAAPASVKTVSQSDLADEGAMFRFGSTDRDEVQNSIDAKYYRAAAFSPTWLRSLNVSDVPAGENAMIGSVELEFVRTDAMATGVTTVVLNQRKRILKTVRFDVWWDKTDLRPGDTITVEGAGFWESIKFLITSCSPDGITRATFQAVEWWAQRRASDG